MAVLIAGCGDLGLALARCLASRGERVYGLRRQAAALDGAVAGLVPIAGDLAREEGLPAIPADVDAVVHCAAPKGGDESAYRAVYLDGLRRLLAAAMVPGRPRPLRAALFVSSTSVYGASDGDLDESSPAGPRTEKARLLLAAEDLLLRQTEPAAGGRAAPADGVRGTVLRLSGIYGPGRWHLGFVDALREGAPIRDEPERVMNRIHRDDAAAAAAFLLGRPDAAGERFLGTDLEPSPLRVFASWVAARLALGAPRFAPSAVAPAATAGASEPSGRGRADSRRRLSSARLRGRGFEFSAPTFREGYAAELDRLRERAVVAARAS